MLNCTDELCILHHHHWEDYQHHLQDDRASHEHQHHVMSGDISDDVNEIIKNILNGTTDSELSSLSHVVDECKRRWRNLRDAFTREVRRESKNGYEHMPKRKKYMYYDQMRFLIPVIECRRLDRSLSTTIKDDPDRFTEVYQERNGYQDIMSNVYEGWDAISRLKAQFENSSDNGSPVLEPQVTITTQDGGGGGGNHHQEDEDYEDDDGGGEGGSQDQRSPPSAVDPDRMFPPSPLFPMMDPDAQFLLSLVPMFKGLKDSDKSRIRIEFQQILHSALYPEVPPPNAQQASPEEAFKKFTQIMTAVCLSLSTGAPQQNVPKSS